MPETTPPRALPPQPGLHEPVILLVSRREVEQGDLDSVLARLRIFVAAREDAWRYRAQMTLIVDGYDDDPRELVDIPQVRTLVARLAERWPYWAFFLNRLDASLVLLFSCAAGAEYLGAGAVRLDNDRVRHLLALGQAGLDELFARFGLPDAEREGMTRSLLDALADAGIT